MTQETLIVRQELYTCTFIGRGPSSLEHFFILGETIFKKKCQYISFIENGVWFWETELTALGCLTFNDIEKKL